eukprot:SAG31_NODE_26878_length_435_cov_0.598214_1_plen_38_part_10
MLSNEHHHWVGTLTHSVLKIISVSSYMLEPFRAAVTLP